jgi:hypothetical protein
MRDCEGFSCWIIFVDGLRAVDVPPKSPRYRSLPASPWWQELYQPRLRGFGTSLWLAPECGVLSASPPASSGSAGSLTPSSSFFGYQKQTERLYRRAIEEFDRLQTPIPRITKRTHPTPRQVSAVRQQSLSLLRISQRSPVFTLGFPSASPRVWWWTDSFSVFSPTSESQNYGKMKRAPRTTSPFFEVFSVPPSLRG